MPSFASFFITVTAALAAFATAAPMNGANGATDALTNAGTTTTNSLSGANVLAGGSGVPGANSVGGSFGGNRRDTEFAHIEKVAETIQQGAAGSQKAAGSIKPPTPPTPTKRGDDLASLPEILLELKARIGVLHDRLHRIIIANVDVKVEVLLPILDELCDTIVWATGSIKLLAGAAVSVVLRLNGRVVAIVEAANLLALCLQLTYSIVGIVVQVCGSARAEIVRPALATVARVVVDLLVACFASVNGLLAVLVPMCDTIIALTRVWGFANVLAVLKV